AMSAGTMIAMSCKEIVMGKHSSLGPIDPQTGGVPAHGIVEEFARARDEILNNPATIPLWQPIINKYAPTLIGQCEKAITWSIEMVRTWLKTGMFQDEEDSVADPKIDQILAYFGSHALTKAHARHIPAHQAKGVGLVVTMLEDDQELQNAVLTAYHSFVA